MHVQHAQTRLTEETGFNSDTPIVNNPGYAVTADLMYNQASCFNNSLLWFRDRKIVLQTILGLAEQNRTWTPVYCVKLTVCGRHFLWLITFFYLSRPTSKINLVIIKKIAESNTVTRVGAWWIIYWNEIFNETKYVAPFLLYLLKSLTTFPVLVVLRAA